MTKPAKESPVEPHAELFPHGADVGVRGIGPTSDAAFEQAALALTSAVTDPDPHRLQGGRRGDL
jgi:tRNA nucleotidyltransferase (CCA-adding enzyme)